MTESSTYSPELSCLRPDAQATNVVIGIRSTKQRVLDFLLFIFAFRTLYFPTTFLISPIFCCILPLLGSSPISGSEERPVQKGKRESPGLRPRSSMKVFGRETQKIAQRPYMSSGKCGKRSRLTRLSYSL
jgi:hypothetical protein